MAQILMINNLEKRFLAIILFLSAVPCYAIDCAEEYKRHLQNDLALSYDEFDQTLGKGMRPLANAGCAKEAADLIVAYIEKNNDKHNSLVWHVAQQRALQDDKEEAVKYAKMALLKTEDYNKNPLRWNDFVLATIAFLEKDRRSFDEHKAHLERAKDTYFGNALNFKLLEKLSQNFEKNYKDATDEGN
jgi:hypothetical protein